MTIVVGLQAHNYALVYSDSQTVNKGKSEAPRDKTFRLNQMIGGYSGLLRWNDMWVDEHIRTIIDSKHLAPARAVEVIEEPFRAALTSLGPNWLRRLDIVFATKKRIARIEFHPVGDTSDIEARTFLGSSHHTVNWMAIGTDGARAAAMQALNSSRIERMNRAQVRMLVERAVVAGIENGGDHPTAPGVRSCCGPVHKKET